MQHRQRCWRKFVETKDIQRPCICFRIGGWTHLWKWAYQRLIWYPIVELYPNSQVDHSNHHVIIMTIMIHENEEKDHPTIGALFARPPWTAWRRNSSDWRSLLGRWGDSVLCKNFLPPSCWRFLFFAHQRCITSFGQAETSLVYPSFQWRLHGAQPCGLFAEVAEKEETWWRASRGSGCVGVWLVSGGTFESPHEHARKESRFFII